MRVIDSFLFFNEYEVLDLRLQYLKDVVDYFIICEGNCTYSGKSKPYYLDEIIDKFDDDIKSKIISIRYEPDISDLVFKEINVCDLDSAPWQIEREQRNFISQKLNEFSPDDLFMLSDVDEIPKKEVIKKIISDYSTLEDNFLYAAKCDMFYYNFSTFYNNTWAGTIFTKVKTAIKYECEDLRRKRFQLNLIENGGWHFSYFGNVEKIKNKIQSSSHQEFNKEKYTNEDNIIESIKNKKDILKRGQDFKEFNFLNYPKDLQNLIVKIFSKNFYNMKNSSTTIRSGATETCYLHLQEHYTFPENVFVSHLPDEIKKSNHQYKILWAHHAYDQPIFLNFDHNLVNHIVSPSQWNKDQLVRFLNIPEHKITVIPNGVSEMFQHSIQKTKTMIFTSIPYKGLEVLSKVIPLISQVHPDVKFKIFSSMSLYGPSNDQFIDLYEYLKSIPNVEYSCAINRDELIQHYQESAFFIHPNIWEETFCVSMCEAMRCGAYPIITNIGALAEVAGEKNATVVPIEGENTSKGWKVTNNFIHQFANACCLALDYYDKQPEFYQEVSKIISDYVIEKYDWKNIADQWKQLIRFIQGDNIEKNPVYYCMINTKNSEKYTKFALDSFFRNTQFGKKDKFFLIDNDGKYQPTEYTDQITLISNNIPKPFSENMNLVMKLALIDGVDFIGLNNDIAFTKNWNKNIDSESTILVPLCNQDLVGNCGSLKIEPLMNLEDLDGKENDLNVFVENIDPESIDISKSIIPFYCFYVPNKVLSNVGFFDENFKHGGEDIDYRLRAHKLGFNVEVNFNSYLIHFCGKSSWRSGENKKNTLDREKQCYNYFSEKWGQELADQLLTKSCVT